MLTPQKQEVNWREEVMAQSLSGFSYYEYERAFLQALLHLQPNFSSCLTYINRNQAMNFLNTHCSQLNSLLSNKHESMEYGEVFPYLGWYELEWEGQRVEVAFLGGTSSSATFCLGEDADQVKLFTSALEKFADFPANRCLRYAEGWENSPDLDAEIGRITWDDIVLQPAMLERVRESVETFFAQKEILQDFGFPWKRGILLVGPPGTGKTMICKAAAAALPELPFLYVRDLRERNKKESIEAIFGRARRVAPCILAMEDLDSLIDDSNRAIFLNEMDGFQSNEGILIIASSNHPGKIDEAFLKRPSRFDRVFHIGLPEIAERRAFCEKILSGERIAARLAPDFERAELAQKVAAKTDGFTPAYLKEAFVSAALSLAQSGVTTLDERFTAAVMEQIDELKAHLKRAKNPEALAEMRSQSDTIGFRR